MTDQQPISPNDAGTIYSRAKHEWMLTDLTPTMSMALRRLVRDGHAFRSAALGLVDIYGAQYRSHTVKGLVARGLAKHGDTTLVPTKSGRECVGRSP